MSLATDSRSALVYPGQDAVLDHALRLPVGIARELDALMSPAFRDRGRAAAVLRALAATGRPLSRVQLGEELGIPASALGRTITFLDENGFVTWTRRFGVGLGVRFLDCEGAFRSHLDATLLRLVTPHLEMLARDHGGTAFAAARAGATVVIVGAEGPAARALVTTESATDVGVMTVADEATSRPWSRVEQNFSLPVRGIWATAREDGGVTIAARVTLAHSAASIGLTTTTASLENYAIRCQALLESAGQLTSALRRQYPH
jgi:hypothetical protein